MVGRKERILLFFQQNGMVVAAILVALLVYSGVVPLLNRYPYQSLIPPDRVEALDCVLVSNPVKTGSGTFYRCTVELEQVSGAVENGAVTATSQASGRATVFLPTAFVEAHYPGKLYSAVLDSSRSQAATTGLVEQGARLSLKVRSASQSDAPGLHLAGGEPVFYGSDCRYNGFSPGWRGTVQRFRGLCRLQFKRLMYGWGDAGGLLVALLCGSAEYTDRAVGDAFRQAGLAHVLALSGMHLSFFAGLAAGLVRGTGRHFSRLFSLLAVVLFVWFAGLSPSLLRSLIGSLLGMAAGLWGIRCGMVRMLALCFFLHLMLAPHDLLQLSFQLSYLALAGILLAGPLFEPATHRFLPSAVASSVSASVGAQIFSTPVTLLSLGTMMPGGIVASVVVSPLVSVFMTVGVVAIILSLLWPPLGEPLGHLVNLLYTCVTIPVRLFAKIPILELS